MTNEEIWGNIEKLSDIRASYSCFDENERPYYHALSAGIKCIKALAQEPCEDCISREGLREPRFIIAENDYQKGWNDVLDSVYENAPSIQPKTGRWIAVMNGRGGHECSECGEYAPSFQSGREHLTNYCPNCGAKMVESQEREENNADSN